MYPHLLASTVFLALQLVLLTRSTSPSQILTIVKGIFFLEQREEGNTPSLAEGREGEGRDRKRERNGGEGEEDNVAALDSNIASVIIRRSSLALLFIQTLRASVLIQTLFSSFSSPNLIALVLIPLLLTAGCP